MTGHIHYQTAADTHCSARHTATSALTLLSSAGIAGEEQVISVAARASAAAWGKNPASVNVLRVKTARNTKMRRVYSSLLCCCVLVFPPADTSARCADSN